jgi:predicted deacylase
VSTVNHAGALPFRVAAELNVDSLEAGCVHRLYIDLVHDGLGRPLRLPVLVARGTRPGPTFGLTAALHGNELNGIPVVHGLFRKLEPQTLRGTVVGVAVVNVPGYLRHQRRFVDGTDLNHIMPGVRGGNASQVYAHRLLDRIVRNFDYLIDLHTASFGRINSLYVRADMTHEVTARMAYLQRPQIIVHNLASDRTLRGAAMELGIPAITVEIGNPHRFQRDYIRNTVLGLRAVLGEFGLLRKQSFAPGKAPILCERSYWLYTDHGGLLEVLPGITERVQHGDLIAHIRGAFGDLEREFHSPEDGVVIGKSVNPVAETGARILHLGVVAGPGDARFIGREPSAGQSEAH